MMQRQSTPLSRLLAALLGSMLLGVSAVAVSETDPPAQAGGMTAAEPSAIEPAAEEPAIPGATEPAVASATEPAPIAPPYNIVVPGTTAGLAHAAQPAPATPEAITVTAELNETDYQRIFEDLDANRNGFIEPPEYRPGLLPDAVIARIEFERQMARTDGRNEGGYEAPGSASPRMR